MTFRLMARSAVSCLSCSDEGFKHQTLPAVAAKFGALWRSREPLEGRRKWWVCGIKWRLTWLSWLTCLMLSCWLFDCLEAWLLDWLISYVSILWQIWQVADMWSYCLEKNMLIPLYNSHGFCRLKCPSTWGDEVYSGSLHCGDRNLVISISLQQEAWLVALKLFCRMISGPFLGALCDYHGRNLELPGGQGPLSLGPADLGIFGKPNHPSQFGVCPNNRSGWWFQRWILFSIIYGIILPIDFQTFIFFKMLKPPTRHKPQTSLGWERW